MSQQNLMIKKDKTIYPSDWKKIKLGELGKFFKGKGISKAETKDTGIPCILYGEIYTDHHIYIKKIISFIDRSTASKSVLIKKGDILFTGSGETKEEIGKAVVYLDENEAYAGGDIIILRQNRVNSLYLSYVLNSYALIKQRAILGQGHSVVHIYQKDLESLELYLPSLKEQNKIAEILSTWDKVIELKEKLIEQKNELKKGLMQKLLTGEVRLPGFDGEWEQVRLGTVIEECTEKTTVNNQYPVLTSSRKGIFLQEEYFSKQVASENNIGYKVVRKGDFTYRTMSDDGNFVFNQLEEYEVGIVSPAYAVFKATNINPLFLKSILNSYDFKKNILRNVQGGTRLSYKYSDLKNTVVKVPPKEEQSAIAEVIFNIENNLNLLEQELEALKQQKKGLMQLLLTGKVRVQV